jgi:hypothetical protein
LDVDITAPAARERDAGNCDSEQKFAIHQISPAWQV